jgi:hypothetical protein
MNVIDLLICFVCTVFLLLSLVWIHFVVYICWDIYDQKQNVHTRFFQKCLNAFDHYLNFLDRFQYGLIKTIDKKFFEEKVKEAICEVV